MMNQSISIEQDESKWQEQELQHRIRATSAILHMARLQNEVMQEKASEKIPWYHSEVTERELLDGLQSQVDWLDELLSRPSTPGQVIRACVHIANFAVMIVDKMESSMGEI